MNIDFQLHILAEVAVAMFFGGIIGLEREAADKPAGFRTHMLVAGSAALLVGISKFFITIYPIEEGARLQYDPFRVVEAIVTGISFLGAGTIFRLRENRTVEGLTTAATILFSASIGICVAFRQIALAGGATFIALTVLRGAHVVEDWLTKRRSQRGRAPGGSSSKPAETAA